MQSFPLTAITYTLALFFAFIFALMAERSKQGQNRIFYRNLSLMVIILFCGLRFFVGNDYYEYFRGFQSISKYNLSFLEQRWEPGIYVLTQIFKKSQFGYFLFLFSCNVITYIFIFKVLVYNKTLKWGVFFTFTLGLLIMANDQVRQGVSLSIFLFSIKYIEQNNFKKYIQWIIIASLFHYSAIALIPVFFLKKIKLNSLIFSSLIIMTFLGYKFGIFYKYILLLIEKIPYYGEIYIARMRFFQIEDSGSGLIILFNTLIALFVALYYNKINKPIYATLFLYGSIIAIFSVGYMPITRFSYFLVYTNIIVLPIMLKHNFNKLFTNGLIVISFIYFFIVSLYGFEKHGAVPYRTILFENIVSPKSEYLTR